jgi:hypothetical protein
MTAIAQRETPHLGIFWLVQPSNGDARLLTAARIGAARHVTHKQGLEDRPAERETKYVFQQHFVQTVQSKDAGNRGSYENANAVARYAVHGRSEHLTPAYGNVALMESRKRFPASQDI